MVLGYVFRYTKSNTSIVVDLLGIAKHWVMNSFLWFSKWHFLSPKRSGSLSSLNTRPLVVKEVTR